jgi:hypothetical protein
VDRRNLKIINLGTHYKPNLALEMNSSPRERGKTNQPRNKADEHSDLFYRGSVLKNLVPFEVVTKTGSLSTLSSLKRSLRPSELSSLLLTGHLDPARINTQLVSLALLTNHLRVTRKRKESQPSKQEQQETQVILSQALMR